MEWCPRQPIDEVDFCIINHDWVILWEAKSNCALQNRLLYECNWPKTKRLRATGSLRTLFAEGNLQWKRLRATGCFNIPFAEDNWQCKEAVVPIAEDNCAGKEAASEREIVDTPISERIVQEEVKMVTSGKR